MGGAAAWGVGRLWAGVSLSGVQRTWGVPTSCTSVCDGLHHQLDFGAVGLRAQMSGCMKLVRLGSRGSCGADRAPEPSCWRDGYRCVCLCILTSAPLCCSATGARRMRLLVLCECSLCWSLLPVLPAVCVCIHRL